MQFPDPTPGPGEVVVEMKASGMCGSDLHQYRRSRTGGPATGLPTNPESVIAGTNRLASSRPSASGSIPVWPRSGSG